VRERRELREGEGGDRGEEIDRRERERERQRERETERERRERGESGMEYSPPCG
jgi:hypothetical protein